GGPSDEYEVSMRTGSEVLSALNRQNVPATDIIVNKQGEWVVHGFVKDPSSALMAADVVFVALHGAYGEDGSVQRILDRVGIPYTGSRAYPSSLAMNKILSKDVLRAAGVKIAPHMRVNREHSDVRRVAASLDSLFGPSFVVKPVNGGSSIDTYIVHGMHELVRALQESFKKRSEVLVEKYIKGKEATVGVVEGLRGTPHYVL